MPEIRKISVKELEELIIATCPAGQKVYGIPTGGTRLAELIKHLKSDTTLVDKPEEASLIVDDLVDSGKTFREWRGRFPGKEMYFAYAKFGMQNCTHVTVGEYTHKPKQWLTFPWDNGTGAEDIVIRLLQFIGESPDREGLKDTPKRFLKAWKHYTSGYDKDPASVLTAFEDGGENYSQMITLKDSPFYSMCEHHLAPFFGTITIAYIPNGKIVGLSKLIRLTDIYCRRLQVQERLTTQIAESIMKYVNPQGAGVIVKARHLCMESRGIEKTNSETVTSALLGNFRTDDIVRTEFLSFK